MERSSANVSNLWSRPVADRVLVGVDVDLRRGFLEDAVSAVSAVSDSREASLLVMMKWIDKGVLFGNRVDKHQNKSP